MMKVCDDECYKQKYKKVFKMLSTIQKSSQDTVKNTVCRTCLKSGTRDSFLRIQDNKFDGNIPIKISKMLDVIVPELALSLTQNPFICLKCAKQVTNSYTFRRQCLETETIIDMYMKNTKCKTDNLDLLEVSRCAESNKFRLADNIISEWEDDSTEKNVSLQPLEPTVPKYQLKTVRSYSKFGYDGKPHKTETHTTYSRARLKNENFRNKLQTSWNSTLPGGIESVIISENLKEPPVFCKETGLFKNHKGKYITLDGELMKDNEIEAAKSRGSEDNRLMICEETGLFKNKYNDYFNGNGEPVDYNDVEAEKRTATVRGHHLFRIGEVFSVKDENMPTQPKTDEKINKPNDEIILIDDDPEIEKTEENVKGKTMLRIRDLSSMKSQSVNDGVKNSGETLLRIKDVCTVKDQETKEENNVSDKTNVGKLNSNNSSPVVKSIKMVINGKEKYPEQNSNIVPVENQSLPLTKVQIQSTSPGARANQEPTPEKSPLPSETQLKSDTKKKLRVKVKRCFVPSCDNTSLNSSKIFIHLPHKQHATWFTAVGRSYIPKVSAGYYCCEDHFDMEADCANWQAYQLIRSSIIMKLNVIPHKYIKNKSEIPKRVTQFRTSARHLKSDNINAFLEKVQMNLDNKFSCSIAGQPTLEQLSTANTQIGPSSSDESVSLPENSLVMARDSNADSTRQDRCEEVTVKKEIQDMEFEGGRLEFNYLPIDEEDTSSASETMVQENIQGLIDTLDAVDSYVDVPEFVQINNFTFKDLEVLKEKGTTSSNDRSNLTSFLQALPPAQISNPQRLSDMTLKDMLNTVPDDTVSTRTEMLEKLICNQIEQSRPGKREKTSTSEDSVEKEMRPMMEKEIGDGKTLLRRKESSRGDTPKKPPSNPPRPWRIDEVPESPPKIVKRQRKRRLKIVPVTDKTNTHHAHEVKYPDREICVLFTNYSEDGLYINDHDYLKTPYKRNKILLEENGELFCLCFICGCKHNITEHVEHMHSHEPNCSLCDINLGTSYMLNLHMKSHAIACNYCLELVAHSKLKAHADVCQKYYTSFHENGLRKTYSNSQTKSKSSPVKECLPTEKSDEMKESEEKIDQFVRTNTPRKRLVKRRKTTDSMTEDITEKRVLRSALKKTESSELPST